MGSRPKSLFQQTSQIVFEYQTELLEFLWPTRKLALGVHWTKLYLKQTEELLDRVKKARMAAILQGRATKNLRPLIERLITLWDAVLRQVNSKLLRIQATLFSHQSMAQVDKCLTNLRPIVEAHHAIEGGINLVYPFPKVGNSKDLAFAHLASLADWEMLPGDDDTLTDLKTYLWKEISF